MKPVRFEAYENASRPGTYMAAAVMSSGWMMATVYNQPSRKAAIEALRAEIQPRIDAGELREQV